MTAPPREQCPKVAIGELCSCYSYGKGADYCPFAAPAPSAEPPAQAATDDLVRRLTARAAYVRGEYRQDLRDAADLIERQAREIARLDARNLELCHGWSSQNERAERAEAERDALRECLKAIIGAYDSYRRRGVAPAPVEYADIVRSIDAARAKVQP